MRYTIVFKSVVTGSLVSVSASPHAKGTYNYETTDLERAIDDLNEWNGLSKIYQLVTLDENNNFIPHKIKRNSNKESLFYWLKN